MLGMKPGDSLVQANGIALKGIDDIVVAFVKPLIASQPVQVAGVRDGKPAAWVFVNAGACPGLISACAFARGSQPRSADGWSMCSVRRPGLRRLVRFDVTVTGDDRAHSRGNARRDIALGIAHIDASLRRDAEKLRGGKQRRRMRLREWRRVAADDRGGALVRARGAR